MKISYAARVFFTAPIRFYRRFISPLKPRCCRFTPSCSEYALRAVMTHGIISGSVLAIYRILRCNPFGGCGEDPVPEYGSLPHEKLFIHIKNKKNNEEPDRQ